MVLQAIQGFDDPNSRFEAGWVSGAAVTSFQQFTPGRHPDRRCAEIYSSASFSTVGFKTYTLSTPAATCVFGGAFRCESATNHSTSPLLSFYASLNIVYLKVAGGLMTVTYSGASGEVTAPTTHAMDTAWHYLELKAKFHASTGIIEVRVDGQVVFSYAGATAAADNITGVALGYTGSSSNHFFWDDVYVLDATGSVNNDFLGDVQVGLIAPSAPGDSTEWSSDFGENWENAADPTFDYVYSDVVGDTDLYNLATLGADYEVFAVQPAGTVYKDDAGVRTVDFVTVLDTDEVTSSAGTLGTTPNSTTVGTVQNLAPDGAAWDRDKVEALQLGVRVAS